MEPQEPSTAAPPRDTTMVDPYGPAAVSDDLPDTPLKPARPLSPLTILGLIALVACGACTIALLLREEGEPILILGLITATCGLIGAWLVAWGRSWQVVMPAAVVLLGLASLCFSLRWQVPGWPTAGIGLGALAAWSYARRGRAMVATVVLLAAGYAVAAASGLLMAMRGTGHWYIAGQGLGSMILGGLFLRLGTGDSEQTGEEAEPAKPSHGRLRVAGRLLIVCGILLPYAALVLQAVGKALSG